jgi:hypothetical protein
MSFGRTNWEVSKVVVSSPHVVLLLDLTPLYFVSVALPRKRGASESGSETTSLFGGAEPRVMQGMITRKAHMSYSTPATTNTPRWHRQPGAALMNTVLQSVGGSHRLSDLPFLPVAL